MAVVAKVESSDGPPSELIRIHPEGHRAVSVEGRWRIVADDPELYRDRVRVLPGAAAVEGKKALVVGLGSVGADLATRLVRLGVDVVGCDPDRLEMPNYIRWGLLAAPSATLGKTKASVWAGAVERAVPGGRVRGVAMDVAREAKAFVELVREFGPDLTVVATDTRDSRQIVNAFAADESFSTLYVSLAEGASSVRIELVVDAKAGPCHLCSTAAEHGAEGLGDRARSTLVPYADGSTPVHEAVPALPANIALGTGIATRIALEWLAGGDTAAWMRRGEQKGSVLFVSLEPNWWVFDEPLSRFVYAPMCRPECPVCGGDVP